MYKAALPAAGATDQLRPGAANPSAADRRAAAWLRRLLDLGERSQVAAVRQQAAPKQAAAPAGGKGGAR
jgi:hypothetical protein